MLPPAKKPAVGPGARAFGPLFSSDGKFLQRLARCTQCDFTQLLEDQKLKDWFTQVVIGHAQDNGHTIHVFTKWEFKP